MVSAKVKCRHCDHRCFDRYMINHTIKQHPEKIDKIRLKTAMKHRPLQITFLHNNEPTPYFCCLGCLNCWLSHKRAEEHVEHCDDKEHHVEKCKKLLGDEPADCEGVSAEDIEKIVGPLNENIRRLEKEIKDLNYANRSLKADLEEFECHSIMFKRLVWGLCELYNKDERRRLMEQLETIKPNAKYPEMDWEGELLVNYDKSAVFTNDLPEEEYQSE